MTDSLPRLYRSLEKRSGSGDLDRVVMAAVASYIAMRRPGEAHGRNLSRLILPAWSNIAAETQAEVASHLALSTELPRELTGILATAPVTILTPEELPPLDVAEEQTSTAAVEDETSSPAAEEARAALRRLVHPGRSTEASLQAASAGLPAALQTLAPSQRFAFLARLAGLDPAFERRMGEDRSGFLPALALKAIGAETDEAMAAVLLLLPDLALDGDALGRLRQDYRALSREDCRARLGLLAILPPVHPAPLARRQPREADVGVEANGDRRRVFGRRRSAPLARQTLGA